MAERSLSIAELRSACQEHKWTNSRGLTRLNRYVSVYVTAVVIRTSISANSITLWSILLGLAGSVFFLAGDHRVRLASAGLLYLSFLFDQVDGEVARYWNATSLTGAFLDEIRHILIYATPVFAVGLRLVMDGAPPLVAGAGFVSALSLGILRFSRNAKYVLVTKKLLAAANGSVEPHRASDGVRSGRPVVARLGRLRVVVTRLVGVLFYVVTNQVSLLLLLFLFQLISPHVGLARMVSVYVGYCAVLAAFTVFDIYSMHHVRLERSCAELLSRIHRERALGRPLSDE